MHQTLSKDIGHVQAAMPCFCRLNKFRSAEVVVKVLLVLLLATHITVPTPAANVGLVLRLLSNRAAFFGGAERSRRRWPKPPERGSSRLDFAQHTNIHYLLLHVLTF